jgi:hypothetical protein
MNYIIVVKIIYGLKDLPYGLRGVFFCKLSILANAIEKLSASSQLGHNVVFVLYIGTHKSASGNDRSE